MKKKLLILSVLWVSFYLNVHPYFLGKGAPQQSTTELSQEVPSNSQDIEKKNQSLVCIIVPAPCLVLPVPATIECPEKVTPFTSKTRSLDLARAPPCKASSQLFRFC